MAATNALPETFVDHAEEIWSLKGKKSQEQMAIDKGWSRSKVADYNALNKITDKAWGVVANATFSEGLLRDILDLCEYH